MAQAKEITNPDIIPFRQYLVVPTCERSKCMICCKMIPTASIMALANCTHSFCHTCLKAKIQQGATGSAPCPYPYGRYNCKGILEDTEIEAENCESEIQEREIKQLLSEEDFSKYLDKSLRKAEAATQNSFHCLTPNCIGWCEVAGDGGIFICQVCYQENCLVCKVIHTAMRCPTCLAVLSKTDGCDWMVCAGCSTEICWATRGPRWGPNGPGDISGGCRCQVNGVLCHQDCQYCH
ncbi:hypothetical protein quinque_010781 [Culex quinquefasciatus]